VCSVVVVCHSATESVVRHITAWRSPSAAAAAVGGTPTHRLRRGCWLG
jgi:hypothetical protein